MYDCGRRYSSVLLLIIKAKGANEILSLKIWCYLTRQLSQGLNEHKRVLGHKKQVCPPTCATYPLQEAISREDVFT